LIFFVIIIYNFSFNPEVSAMDQVSQVGSSRVNTPLSTYGIKVSAVWAIGAIVIGLLDRRFEASQSTTLGALVGWTTLNALPLVVKYRALSALRKEELQEEAKIKRIEEELNSWAAAGSEDEDRQGAAKAIKEAYLEKRAVLNLTQFKLRELPNCIGELMNLGLLDVSYLSALPPTIGGLTNLWGLVLGTREGELVELPKEIGSLTKLRCLSLSGHEKLKLPLEIVKRKLSPEIVENLKKLSLHTLVLPENITNSKEEIEEILECGRIRREEKLSFLEAMITDEMVIEWATAGNRDRANQFSLFIERWRDAKDESVTDDSIAVAEGLVNWVSGGDGTEDRGTAADRIFRNYLNKGSDLDLSSLGLSSLPHAIGKLTCLEHLDFSGNPDLELQDDMVELRYCQKLWMRRFCTSSDFFPLGCLL
jgi:hypothetical protein